MNTIWDSRFSTEHYQYGKNPNEFLKRNLDSLPKGKILICAAGEGRDAIYAAKLGWEVIAFDQSVVGREKALALAKENKVEITYLIGDALTIELNESSFDAIASIFLHLPPELRTKFHQRAINWLKPNGVFILEGFSKNQLGNNSGGPKDLDWLFSKEELAEDFSSLSNVKINYETRILDEGPLHQGNAELVHLVKREELINN